MFTGICVDVVFLCTFRTSRIPGLILVCVWEQCHYVATLYFRRKPEASEPPKRSAVLVILIIGFYTLENFY